MSSKKTIATRVTDNAGREWGPRRGLEGPFRFRGGRVLYYDPREEGGTYYDPSTDMYLTHEEAYRITSGYRSASLRRKILRLAHSRPDLRQHLLPLLAKTSSWESGEAGAGGYDPGFIQRPSERGDRGHDSRVPPAKDREGRWLDPEMAKADWRIMASEEEELRLELRGLAQNHKSSRSLQLAVSSLLKESI